MLGYLQLRIVAVIFWCCLFITSQFPVHLHAQYVRRSNFLNEQQRRAHFRLDDWISYLNTRRFTTMTVGVNYIYIATKDGGILRYHIYENFWDYPFTTSSGLPDNRILNVVFDDKTSLLWAITPEDRAVFNPASEEWIIESETPDWDYVFPETANSSQYNEIPKEIFRNREALNSLPTFFANGSYTILDDWLLLDENFEEFPFTGFLLDRYDRVWFLVDGFGVGIGNLYSQRVDFLEFGIPNIIPRAIAYQNDDIWIGGLQKDRSGRPGIARWPYGEVSWEYFQARWIGHLPSDEVTSIVSDGDSVWFATRFGVALFDAREYRWKNFSLRQGLISNEINDVAILNDYLYAATDQGISRIHRTTGIVERINDTRFVNLPFRRLAVQGDTLWAATFRGAFRFADSFAEWEFVPGGAAIHDIALTAVADNGQEIWFAGDTGVYWLDLKTGKWESYPQVSLEVEGPYTDIKATKEAVWVATRAGLLKFDRVRLFWRLFTTRDGLLNNDCHQLALDGDYIWIVTDKGVTQFYWNNPNRSD